MGSLIAAMASSHAFAVMDPERWEEFRATNRAFYERRYGTAPPPRAEVAAENLDGNKQRYRRVSEAHDRLRRELLDLRPDVVLLIGDDQNEHFREENVPQIAIYNGGDFRTGADGKPYRCDTGAANLLLDQLVERDFDVSIIGHFPDDRLISHAHVHILERLLPEREFPIVPVFVNGIHVPALVPRRCHALGRAIRDIIERDLPVGARVAAIASGGLSHFSAGYPWSAYRGPFQYGDICVDFDQRLIASMARGEGATLADTLTSSDLLAHGEIEFRCWLVVLGMVGAAPAEILAYEPFYRAIMGIGVGRWQLPAAGSNRT